MIIGVSAGGDYDLRARLVARYMSKHIPGNPKIVPQNMLGAGGLVAANWLANVAPKDGTAMLAISSNLPVGQARRPRRRQIRHPQVQLHRQHHRQPQRHQFLAHDRRHQDRAGHGEGVRGRGDRAQQRLLLLSRGAECVRRHQIQDRVRLSRRRRREHRDGTRRGRRPRLQSLGVLEIDAAAMAGGEKDSHAGADRAQAAPRTPRRAADAGTREVRPAQAGA